MASPAASGSGRDDAGLSADDALLIPFHRFAAWHRAAWLGAAAMITGLPAWLILPRLRFVPSAASNRLGDYAIAIVLMCVCAVGLVMLIQAVRWTRLALSRRATGFRLDAQGIAARLHPMEEWAVKWEELDIEWPEYLFALDLEKDEPLPMRECPAMRIARPSGGVVRVDVSLRRYSGMPEELWWPAIERRIRDRVFSDWRWRD